jgi:hypothetical protein
MAIEMFLLLWLQLYLGSIFVTLVVVIGGLFVSSAVASWCYQQRSFSVKSLVVRGLFTIIVLGVVFYFPWAIGTFLIRVLVSVIAVAAIGVLLAPFFPFAMQLAENQTTQHAPILFGVNAIALAVTVPISILVVSYTSFEMLLVISVVAYAAALVLLSRIRISA